MLLGVVLGGLDDKVWLGNGGSLYGEQLWGLTKENSNPTFGFFQSLQTYYETNESIFVHAGYDPDKAIHEQDQALTYWNHLPEILPPPHNSGKKNFRGSHSTNQWKHPRWRAYCV